MHTGKGCEYKLVLGCTTENLLFVNHSGLLLPQNPFLFMFPILLSVLLMQLYISYMEGSLLTAGVGIR